jgi:hypothetical protein
VRKTSPIQVLLFVHFFSSVTGLLLNPGSFEKLFSEEGAATEYFESIFE